MEIDLNDLLNSIRDGIRGGVITETREKLDKFMSERVTPSMKARLKQSVESSEFLAEKLKIMMDRGVDKKLMKECRKRMASLCQEFHEFSAYFTCLQNDRREYQ